MIHYNVEIPSMEALKERKGLCAGGAVQRYIDGEVLRLSSSYIPKDTGALERSGFAGTVVGSGEIVYTAPYARRVYYGEGLNFQGAPRRGSYWFLRMKAAHAKEILEGVKRLGI